MSDIVQEISDVNNKILDSLRKKESPYEKCPVYETKQFIFRLVEESDAEDLFDCYSDPASAKIFNCDNCTSNFIYRTLDKMRNCIRDWLEEYEEKHYVRFSIIDKTSGKAIGTIEIFARSFDSDEVDRAGALRLDLPSQYEKEEIIGEIINAVSDNFYDDFEFENMITKAIPEAQERVCALKNRGFVELESHTLLPYDHYFIRAK